MIKLAEVQINNKPAYFTDGGWVTDDKELQKKLNKSIDDMRGYNPSLQQWAADHAVKLFGGKVVYVKPIIAVEDRVY